MKTNDSLSHPALAESWLLSTDLEAVPSDLGFCRSSAHIHLDGVGGMSGLKTRSSRADARTPCDSPLALLPMPSPLPDPRFPPAPPPHSALAPTALPLGLPRGS